MKRLMTFLLIMTMCLLSVMPVYVTAAEAAATYTFAEVSGAPGENVEVTLDFKTTEAASLVAVGGVTFDTDVLEFVGFEYDESVVSLINGQLSGFDEETMSLVTLFNADDTYDVCLGTFTFKIKDDAAEGDVTITATPATQTAAGTVVESALVAGKVTVAVPVAEAAATYAFAEVSGAPGENVEVALDFETTEAASLVAVGGVTFDTDVLEFVGFEYDESVVSLINGQLSGFDEETMSLVTLFNADDTYDVCLGTFTFKIKDNAAEGDVTITATPATQTAAGAVVESALVAGKVTVAVGTPEPVNVLEGITVEPAELEVAHDAVVDKAYLVDAGVVVTAQYSVAEDAVVEDWTYADGVISYTEGDVTKTATITITVLDPPVVEPDVTTVEITAEDVNWDEVVTAAEIEVGQAIADAITIGDAPAVATVDDVEYAGTITLVNGDEVAAAAGTIEAELKFVPTAVENVVFDPAEVATTVEVTVNAAPGAPIVETVAVKSTATTITATVTVDANGADIESVNLVLSTEDAEDVTVVANATEEEGVYEYTFEELTTGKTYTIKASAVNENGTSNEITKSVTPASASTVVRPGGGGSATVIKKPAATEEPEKEEPGTEEPGTEEPGTEEPGTEEPDEVGGISAAAKFEDVAEDDWYAESVDYVVNSGLMNGTEADKFAPNATLTRGMLVTVLYRAEGSPAVNRSIPFSDVELGAYYSDPIIWAHQNGIVTGYDENIFGPNNNVTREQAAAIMYRYSIYKGMEAVDMSENLGFADAAEISEYAISALNWAVGQGLIKGYEDNTVRPANSITRAEMSTILQRYLNK